MHNAIISLNEFVNLTDLENVVVVDCRYFLDDTNAGRQGYLAGHIPGAVYVHLKEDLSGPPATDHGRHPLPTGDALNALFSRLGIDAQSQVVVYDDNNGMIAGRLWWSLRYMGHEAAAILDGGWSGWQAAGHPVEMDVRSNQPTSFHGEANSEMLVVLDDVMSQPLLIDSRGAPRYRGKSESRDGRAGHIPGAKNRFSGLNVDENGFLHSQEALQQQFAELLGDVDANEATFYCGSGVSACINIASVVHSGLGMPRLYVGSWSEWSADPSRPGESA